MKNLFYKVTQRTEINWYWWINNNPDNFALKFNWNYYDIVTICDWRSVNDDSDYDFNIITKFLLEEIKVEVYEIIDDNDNIRLVNTITKYRIIKILPLENDWYLD